MLPNPLASNYGDQAWAALKAKMAPKDYAELWKKKDQYRWHHAQDGSLQLIVQVSRCAAGVTGLFSR
jgi:hypothetical protein